MECFIVENGVERKAELEDILPLITDRSFQLIILREAYDSIHLPYAIAHMADEIKEIVYRNMSSQVRATIEKDVKAIESSYGKDYCWIQNERTKLISLIGENVNRLYELYKYQYRLVWKETTPKEPIQPIEKLINVIEKACVSGRLRLVDTDEMSEKDIQNAFMTFQDRKDELSKIRILDLFAKDLYAVGLLFEVGGIDSLDINGEFDGTWPEFLKDYRTLTSITFNIREGLTELPAWIHNIISLRHLSIENSNITFLPDWIGTMQSLTELDISYGNNNLKTLPESICYLENLVKLFVCGTVLEKLPDNIGNLTSLKELHLQNNKKLTSLPDSIVNLKNITKISIHSDSIQNSALEKLPDSIGNLSSLRELSLIGNDYLKSLPDSIGYLKNLVKLTVEHSALEKLPDSIGDLSSLKELSIGYNLYLTSLPDSMGNLNNLINLDLQYSFIKALPDSIGRLKNLTTLNLCGTRIEKLPDTIADCSCLECVDIRKTKITTFPDFVSSIKTLLQSIELILIPKKLSISYPSFCNCYYTLAETIIRLASKARREGILALEEDLDDFSDEFFKTGITLVVNGTDAEIVREVLTIRIEREHDYYKKRLMEVAMEGILCVQCCYSIPKVALRLASMVDIKNNPLDTACAKYFAGDHKAFDNIDLKAALLPEEERDEIRFIKRALKICEIGRQEGPLAIEKHLDHNGIAARDVFEYGLSMGVIGMGYDEIDKNLTMLIAHESDPVLKNLSLAKKHAVRSIFNGDNPWLTTIFLLSYFDDEVVSDYLSESNK